MILRRNCWSFRKLKDKRFENYVKIKHFYKFYIFFKEIEAEEIKRFVEKCTGLLFDEVLNVCDKWNKVVS